MSIVKKVALALFYSCSSAGCVSFAYDLLHPPLDTVTTYLLVGLAIIGTISSALMALATLLRRTA